MSSAHLGPPLPPGERHGESRAYVFVNPSRGRTPALSRPELPQALDVPHQPRSPLNEAREWVLCSGLGPARGSGERGWEQRHPPNKAFPRQRGQACGAFGLDQSVAAGPKAQGPLPRRQRHSASHLEITRVLHNRVGKKMKQGPTLRKVLENLNSLPEVPPESLLAHHPMTSSFHGAAPAAGRGARPSLSVVVVLLCV